MTAKKADVDFLLNQARVKLPGASDAELKATLFDVLRELFNVSSAWTEDVPVLIVPNSLEYTVVPSGGAIIRLAGVLDANNLPQPAIMPTIGTILFRAPYNVSAEFTAPLVKTVSFPTKKSI